MGTTRACRVADLKPGMGVYDERIERDIRVDRVEIDGDVTLVWLSADGRKPYLIPYDTDDEVLVDETG